MDREIIAKAYGEHWDRIKDFVDPDGWCQINLEENRSPGKCGMKARGYHLENRYPSSNYMGWTHFRPVTLKP